MWTSDTVLRAIESAHNVNGGAAVTARELTNFFARSPSCLTYNQIANALRSLRRSGYVRSTQSVDCMHQVFTITAAGRSRLAAGPIRSGGATSKPRKTAIGDRVRFWRAMRIKVKFSISDLLEIAGAERENPTDNAQKYARVLGRAGILCALPRRQLTAWDPITSNGRVVWLLINNLGPEAPIVRKDSIYDPNSGTTLPLVAEVQA